MTRGVRGSAGLYAAGRDLHPVGGVRLGELLDGVEVAGVDGGGASALELAIGEVRDDSRAVGARRSVRRRARADRRRARLPRRGGASRARSRSIVERRSRASASPACACACASTRAGAGADRRQPLRAARRRADADRRDRHQRQDDHDVPRRGDAARGRRRRAGRHRHGRRIAIADEDAPAPFTTPAPLVLHAMFAEMRAAGATHVVMEASSHALELGRLDGVRFRVAAFTNLTQDHLDFHGTWRRYVDAKAMLFASTCARRGVGVVNVDDEYGRAMAQRRCAGARCAVRDRAGVRRRARDESTQHVDGIDARSSRRRSARCAMRSPLVGEFNLENLALARRHRRRRSGSTRRRSRAASAACAACRAARARATTTRGFACFVDYAHTPDALERVLAALRPLDARAADRRVRLRRRSRPEQAPARWAGGGARRRLADRHQRQPAHRGAARHHRHDRRGRASEPCRAHRRLSGARARRGRSARGDRARRSRRRGRATSCSSPARGTRTTRSSARPSTTSTTAKRRARPLAKLANRAGERSELMAMAQVRHSSFARARGDRRAARPRGRRARPFRRRRIDSRAVQPGALFFAVKGERSTASTSRRRRWRRRERRAWSSAGAAPRERRRRGRHRGRRHARALRRSARAQRAAISGLRSSASPARTARRRPRR